MDGTPFGRYRLVEQPGYSTTRKQNQQPAAAKVLAAMLEKLRSASARARRGHLAVVRTMTEKDV